MMDVFSLSGALSGSFPVREGSMVVLVLINVAVVSTIVVIHNSALWNLSRVLPRIPIGHFKLIIGVLGSLLAHAVEIWIFALVYYFLCKDGGYGTLEGGSGVTSMMDCVYFSFTTYSTLGYGDIFPHGGLRYTTGIESLTGLVMVTWTASFLFLEMTRFWEVEEESLSE